MPAENAPVRWEYIAGQLTGFAGGTREDVGKIGSTADGSAEGYGWLQVKTEVINIFQITGETKEGNFGTSMVVRFYDYPGSTEKAIKQYYKITLNVPWGDDGFKTGGVASAFDYGYAEALDQLKNFHSTTGWGGQYAGGKVVKKEDSVDLNSLITTAKSFDLVRTFFKDHGPKLEQWHKSLGEDDASWQGTGADVFRSLIDGLNLGYKDLAESLAPSGSSTGSSAGETPFLDYTPDSLVGENLSQAATAINKAATDLHDAWDTWLKGDMWLPTIVLAKKIDEVVSYLNTRNITNIHKKINSYYPNETFSIYYEENGNSYGDLRTEEAWHKLAQQAYVEWCKGLKTLDDAATTVAGNLNEALLTISKSNSAFAFNPGFTDLKTKYTEDQTRQLQEDQEQQQKDLEDKKNELDTKLGGDDDQTTPPPKLDPNSLGGGLDDNQTPPGLNDNQTPPSLKDVVPPPTLGLNGPGGGTGLDGAVHNPDGSTTVRNPDGSYTTTFPDGHQEKSPPGSPPPGLGLNGSGLGLGTGPNTSVPLKTTKGPDGSTTTYNQDGSRTITHKDGTTTTIGRDGTTTTVNPDGSTTVLHKDGSETVTYPDGTRTTIRADGSTVTQYKDGSTQTRAADGTLTTTDSDGNKTVSHPAPGQTVHNPDGSTTTFNKDGSTTTVHANGTRTTVSSNGTVTTVDPDGTKTVSHLGKNTSTIEYADGSVAKVDKDGTVVTTYKDGTSTKLGPDGTYTTTDPDGDKKTEHLNPLGGNAGAETKHNADGSTTTKYPDGTVDQKFKDGGHKISYPDGRTVTTDADGRTLKVTGGPTGLGGNKSSGGFGNFDYYDYPDDYKKLNTSLTGSGYDGYGSGGSSAPPPLAANPLGQSLTPPGGASAGGALPGERTRMSAINESAAARGRAAQLAAEESAAMRRPATSSGGMPMMPPMGGGMGGAGGQNTQSDERERATWVSEDEDVWGTDEGGVVGVIGR
ncbi:AAWKG family protein [Streptomyces sp. NBC_01618]|uniref:AAWKG family protein n=1 Tax=Streptomyces sp. NBC_01618 TaxID=2975900 RepID=UPI0038689239|nr:AAWKG family protein [Streptomyces sp. NBC_01618]